MPRYHVVISYSTYADTPEEALSMAIEASSSRAGPYAEVFDEGTDDCVISSSLASMDG